MSQIHTDSELRARLHELPAIEQRRVAKRFVEHVIDLSDNPRVRQALSIIETQEPSNEELGDHFRTAKSAAIDAYTLCGRDADWIKQAGHFVAAAAAVCLMPPRSDEGSGDDLAWETAMNARMARNCEKIAKGETGDDSEAQAQYQIAQEFLGH